MNTIFRAGWVATVLFCAVNVLTAQKSSVNEDLIKADRQFNLYAYNLAMQTYQQVLKDDPNNGHALARVGDCYYQLNNPEKSLEWYQRAIRQYNMEPDVHLRYGKALMQTADYEDARDQFRAYAEADETIGNHYAQLADYAIETSKKEGAWQMKNEALNTEFSDFSPAFLGSRVVYNSARTDMAPKSKNAESTGGTQNFLLVTQRNPESGLLQKPQLLRSELQNTRNEGPVSFSADGRRVAFCRNNFINGTRQIAESGINMSLYIADVDENGKWINSKAFPYNGSNYATGFPSLSPDGNTLIFASTQPGGFGGWDIYVSNFRDGAWTTPRNLGSPLNTPGNEVTPFFDGESLYFSSDWHFGMGGLDVFRAELGAEKVSEVFHLGPGINSPRDDYGFIYDDNDNVAYVTSTRAGGRGAEDIWRAVKKFDNDFSVRERTRDNSDEPYRPSEYNDESNNNSISENKNDKGALHLLITDERGNEIPNAEIDLSDCYGEKGYTDANGQFDFVPLTKAIDCQVVIKKRGFRNTELTLKKFGKQNVRISLTPETRELYRGRVFDSRSKAPVRGVTVMVQFDDNSQNIETQTDADGEYTINLDPGSTYLVNYSKYGYIDQIAKTYFASDMTNIPSILLEKQDDTDYVDYKGQPLRPIEHDTYEGKTITILKKRTVPEQTPPVAPKTNGYSIQLAAMPEEPSENKLRTYEALTKDGNLYVKAENNLNKIRLGVFKTKAEAETVLKKVVQTKGNKDAFVVEEHGADEDLVVGGVKTTTKPAEYSTTTNEFAARGITRPEVVYALQLGTFSSQKSIVVSDYAGLRGLGSLYSNSDNGNIQVRLGVWLTRNEALKAKEEAIDRGFSKATIVTEAGNDPDIQDFIVWPNTDAKKAKLQGDKGVTKPTEYSTVSNVATPYYIRIAALSNPERFNPEPLEDLGRIEKRKAEFSPGMTIILLAGFATRDAADAALTKVLKRGYEDAYIMKEENGKLVRR